MDEKIIKEINSKLNVIILLLSLHGKEEKDKIKFLNEYSKTSRLSKREIEKISGIDRHRF